MPKRPGKQKLVLKYGSYWPAEAHPLAVELECIRRFGRWTFRDRKCGEGLPHHVKQAMKMLWPESYWHRWCDMIVDQFLKSPGRTACFGPSSSGKSFVFSRAALVMFYARPKGTTVLISSTTRDDLKRRIWDYVVASDKSARRKFPDLPGSLIESEMKLLADASTEDGRSFKDGILAVACKKGGKWEGLEGYVGTKNEVVLLVCDECFTGDTLVDTPTGKRRIDSLVPGEEVLNAVGTGVVQAVSQRNPSCLLEVKTRNGTTFKVTPNHPFFTNKGWIKACDLNQSHFILRTDEAVRILRERSSNETESFLRKQLRSEVVALTARGEAENEEAKGTTALCVLPCKESNRDVEQILQLELRGEFPARTTWLRGRTNPQISTKDEGRPRTKSKVEKDAFRANASAQPNARPPRHIKNAGATTADRAQTEMAWWKWNWPNICRKDIARSLYYRDKQFCDPHIQETRERISNALQSGRCNTFYQSGSRVRRTIPQNPEPTKAGFEKDQLSSGDWLDSVAFLEPENYRRDGKCDYGDQVYNLQVSGHPSYSVNGFLVHNCQFMPVGFLDALANLESNEHCYAAIMGNLPDVHNPLGWAAEPKLGWEALQDTDRSRVYETKWKDGRCIQLIGMDSPNLDFPEGQEPYRGLIGRRYIEQCAQNYGRESDKFNMFASGKIPRSSMYRTVFTKAMCMKHSASSGVTWGHEKVTRGYGLDAAYSGVGGDRTVGFPFVFGIDNTKRWRFWLGPMRIYAGSSDKSMSHAEAIALQVKEECEAHGIEPAHVFFDGTGRSELTSAFARLWSSAVVPIEFGGPATERPSFTGERWLEGQNSGDTKACRDVFDRFVSELWFAVRHCIIADQMRGLNDEAIDEGSQRKWELVRGNKYSVETKEDMKERGLRSPDICDAIVVALEGARRLGFPLGKHTVPEKRKQSDLWLRSMAEKQWERAQQEVLAA